MEAVAAATQSFRAILLPVPQERAPIIRVSESLRPTREFNYLDGWVQCDLGSRGVSNLLRDRIVTNYDCRTPKIIDCDVRFPGTPEGVSLPYFAGIKVSAHDRLFCLFIQRSSHQVPFSRAELKKLAKLSSALSAAATEAWMQGLQRAGSVLSVFNLLRWPAFLLDHYGQLIEMNQIAKQIVGDDVKICDGKVASYKAHITATLNRELRAFILSDLSINMKPLMSLPRKDVKRPLLASAIRLSAISQDVFARRQAILILVDLDEHTKVSESVLRRCFALTAAEARLASRLTESKTLDVIAKELAITKGTARHELKSVFAKLNVHRQSELIALLTTRILTEQVSTAFRTNGNVR